MKTVKLRSQFYILIRHTDPINPTANPPYLIPVKASSHLKSPTNPSPFSLSLKSATLPKEIIEYRTKTSHICEPLTTESQKSSKEENSQVGPTGCSRYVILGATSIGFVLFVMGIIEDQKALAMGPEGPMVEEFWDNMRRYALYVLTVSTGVAYTVFQPLLELLKNPLSAILILTITGGSFYIVSQVLSAMVGVSDFSYEYGY